MRMIKLAGASLLTACVAGMMASGALAAAPEVGRCVPSPTKTGSSIGPKCTSPSASHTGAYEWIPGPGPKPAFAQQGAQAVLETTGRRRVSCTGSQGTGSYSGEKTETITITFTECSTNVGGSTVKCQSDPAKEGAIETSALEGEFGFATNGLKRVVAVDLKPKAPLTTIATFTCGKLPEVPLVGTVEGSIIGQVKPINLMTGSINIVFKQTSGHQLIKQLEGGPKDVPMLKLQSGLTTTTEEAGLSQLTVQTGEEPYEVRSKP